MKVTVFRFIFKNKHAGFTLVELLVVMAILGILSVGLIVAINPQKQFAKTRDTARKHAIRQIRGALENHKITYGTYPVNSGWLYSTAAGWQTFLGSELKSVPTDPSQNSCASPTAPWTNSTTSRCWMFAYRSVNGSTYDLVAHLENTDDPDRCEIKQWVYNAAAQVWCPPGLTYSNYIYAPGPNN